VLVLCLLCDAVAKERSQDVPAAAAAPPPTKAKSSSKKRPKAAAAAGSSASTPSGYTSRLCYVLV